MRIASLLAFTVLAAACGSAGASGGDASSSAPSGGWYEQPTPSATAHVASTPISNPLSNPLASPVPVQVTVTAPTPAPPCYPVKGGAASRATITDVRVGRHPGYDRIVLQFSGGLPDYALVPKDPATFVAPGSGTHVAVVGNAAIDLTITGADVQAGYPQGVNLKPGYVQVKDVVVLGASGGQAHVAIGLESLQCPTVAVFSGLRLVIDFPTG